MTCLKTKRSMIIGLCALLALLALPVWSQKGDGGKVLTSVPVVPTVFDGDLRDIPVLKNWQPGDPIKEIPRRHNGTPAVTVPADPPLDRDPLLDAQEAVSPSQLLAEFTTPDLNFAGQGFTGVNPPDTVGDIGPNFFIQMINASGGAVFTIYNKSNGSVAAGPIFLDSLGSGACAGGLGDPVVLYDELAGRWVLAEFSSSGNNMCVYVSQTGDPVSGGWFAYGFQAPSFPDYFKIGVWPDAYYVGSNEAQSALYALDRTRMLQGLSATFQRSTVPDLGGFGFQLVTPSHLNGTTLPPAGSPNFFMRHVDDESHSPGSADPGNDFLEIWEYTGDFGGSPTLNGPISIAVAEFDSTLCGLTSFSCVPQPGTGTQLDPLREPVMFRLQYRNFGTHEAMIGNFAVDVGSNRAGIRWFELRRNGGAWSLHQEGTYSPGSLHRWMGAIAVDQDGNIALGYNTGSSSVFPGLRYVGRLAGDPLGVMTQAEVTLIAGTASNASNRYGDYASMGVDPVDGCTFWFTGEYNVSSSWSTRIGAFSFDTCGSGGGNTTPQVTISSPANGSIFFVGDAVSFSGSANDAEDGDLTTSLSWSSSLDGTIGSGGSFTTTTLSVGNHTITASVTDSGGLTGTSAITLTVNPIGGPCALDEDFSSGANGWINSGASTCTTGSFVIGTPTEVVNGGVTTQLAGDHTTGSGNAFFSAVNTSAGVNDVDGGNCIVTSPVFNVTEASDISIWYYHGQRDAGDDAGGDFFDLEISTDGGATFSSLVSIGDVTSNAAWTEATANVGAGASVQFRAQVSDGAGPGDLVEAGIDDVSICPSGGGGNTAPSVSITAPADGSSFNQGDSVAFAGSATDAEDGDISANLSWSSSLDGTIGSGASFSTSTLSVGTHTITASVTDSGGLSGSDSITVTINAVGACTVEEDFEGGAGGWANSGASTCTTGSFVIGTPTSVVNGGVTTQLAGDHTTGSGNAFFSAVNTSAGVNDVDGGNCVVSSPTFAVGAASTVSIWYYHGQRDAGDDASGDFFELEISTDGGATFSPLVSIGDVTSNASWTEATASVPAGSSVQIRVQASDGAGPGDLVEAGIDDFSICPN